MAMVKSLKERVFNFSPGPAVLPVPVLEEARDELLSHGDAGASVLEISHRSSQFSAILADSKQRLTDLLKVPDSYEVLFLQGGSRLQFSMVPMNLLRGAGSADYIVTGSWGKKAVDEARKEGRVNIVWDGNKTHYNRLPQASELQLDVNAAYVHYTSNETIQGVQFLTEPDVSNVPLVCDASSDFMCRPLSIKKYGLIYACAQKNAGPAGVTVVIIRKDLLERGSDDLPGYCNYRLHAADNSRYNTPPTFGIYIVSLVAKWLSDEIGGLAAMERQNRQKAELLYSVVDEDDFYIGHAQPESRSIMNVTFRLRNDDFQAKFIETAEEHGLYSLKGHRSVGGIRASIYNAIPIEGVIALRDFMLDFRKQNG